jgi:uncharacterized protein YukE
MVKSVVGAKDPEAEIRATHTRRNDTMSQSFLGNDPEQMDRLARRMEDEAAKIEAAQQSVTNELKSLAWTGADRNRFEAEWNGTHAQALKRAADALRQNAGTIKRNAQDQRQVSNT